MAKSREKLNWWKILVPIGLTALLSVPSSSLVTYYVTDHRSQLRQDRDKREAEAKMERLKKEKQYTDLLACYREMKLHLDASGDAFNNQVAARDRLIDLLGRNHGPLPDVEYEKLLRDYYPKLNEEELVLFQLVRGITKTSLYNRNTEMLKLLDTHPNHYHELPSGRALHDHLELWISKFNEFIARKDTCLIYVGVEEKKPFPTNIVEEIDKKLTDLELKRMEHQ